MKPLQTQVTKMTKAVTDALASCLSLVGAGANRNSFMKIQNEQGATKVDLIPNYAPDDSKQATHEVSVVGITFDDSVSIKEAKQMAKELGFSLQDVTTEYLEDRDVSVIYQTDRNEVKEFLTNSTKIKQGNLSKIKQSFSVEDEDVSITFVLETNQITEQQQSVQQAEQKAINEVKHYAITFIQELATYGDSGWVADSMKSLENVQTFEDIQNVFKTLYETTGTFEGDNQDRVTNNSYKATSVIGFEEILLLLKVSVDMALREGTAEQAKKAIDMAFEYRDKLITISNEILAVPIEQEFQSENQVTENSTTVEQNEEESMSTEDKENLQEDKTVNTTETPETSETPEEVEQGSKKEKMKDDKKYSENEQYQAQVTELMQMMKATLETVNASLNMYKKHSEAEQEKTEKLDEASQSEVENIVVKSKVTDDSQDETLQIQHHVNKARQGRDIKNITQGDPIKRRDYLRRAKR